jgi:7-carboxy-7-deazaguanine synthase
VKRYGVKEVFVTLQGEGVRAGTKAVFVRFTGCNLWSGNPADRSGAGPCAAWCDTDFFKGQLLSIPDILARMNAEWPSSDAGSKRWCVLTGGEPCLQIDDALLTALIDARWSIAVETNGTVYNPAVIKLVDWICVAPKLGTNWTALQRADEVKVVLSPDAWNEKSMRTVEAAYPHARWSVQPVDSLVSEPHEKSILMRTANSVKLCIAWIMANPRWSLTLQTHKLIGLP